MAQASLCQILPAQGTEVNDTDSVSFNYGVSIQFSGGQTVTAIDQYLTLYDDSAGGQLDAVFIPAGSAAGNYSGSVGLSFADQFGQQPIGTQSEWDLHCELDNNVQSEVAGDTSASTFLFVDGTAAAAPTLIGMVVTCDKPKAVKGQTFTLTFAPTFDVIAAGYTSQFDIYVTEWKAGSTPVSGGAGDPNWLQERQLTFGARINVDNSFSTTPTPFTAPGKVGTGWPANQSGRFNESPVPGYLHCGALRVDGGPGSGYNGSNLPLWFIDLPVVLANAFNGKYGNFHTRPTATQRQKYGSAIAE